MQIRISASIKHEATHVEGVGQVNMVLRDDVLLVEVQGQVKCLDTNFLHLLTSHLSKRHNSLHVLFQLGQGT